MITKEVALTLKHNAILHRSVDCGLKPIRWRVNGSCKTWKREPRRFRLPIKWGLYQYWYIDENNCHLFHLEQDCPAVRHVAKQLVLQIGDPSDQRAHR